MWIKAHNVKETGYYWMRIEGKVDSIVKVEDNHPTIFHDTGAELKMKEFGRTTILQLSYYGADTKFSKLKERK